MNRTVLPLLLAVTALFPGCDPGPDKIASRTVVDSAGVSIVQIPAREWLQADEWQLSPVPVVRIGVADGPQEYQFHRITSALRLSDGRIVVADNGSKEVRSYSATGIHQWSVGREGGGPGEFRNLAVLGRYGPDSLLAWDPTVRRGTVFDIHGSLGRSFSPPDFGGAFLYGMTMPGDGSVFGRLDEGVNPESYPAGVVRFTARFIRLTPDGAVHTIARLFGNEALIYVRDGQHALTSMPFGRAAVYAVSPGVFFYGTTDTFELRKYGFDGRLHQIIRTDRENSALSKRQIDSFVSDRIGRVADPGSRQRTAERYAQVPFPETLPAFSELMVGSDRTLWAADYEMNLEGGQHWTVFDSGGIVLGTVAVPGRFAVLDVGLEYVLGVSRDEMDVERIELYRVEKPR